MTQEKEGKIPKTLIYCWFGPEIPKTAKIIANCVESWKKTNPDFKIVLINKTNFDVNKYPFTREMYGRKKFAFVVDYVRLLILKERGGVYLDSDMELVKNLTPLLNHELLLGEESPGIISAGMIGVIPNHPFISDALTYYDKMSTDIPETVPRVLTNVFNSHTYHDVFVCPSHYFYPYSAKDIRLYDPASPPLEAYGIHLWNFSWGTWWQRGLHKSKLYSNVVRFLEILKIKQLLKKLLRLS